MADVVLNVETNQPFVQGASDPVTANVVTPADFAAQFPTPLDPTEILAMCEEISLWRTLPEQRTGLQQEIWREMSALAFTSGSSYIAFSDGTCPEEYFHSGSNSTVNLKNLGVKKSLTLSDIIHSAAVVQGGSGIRAILGGWSGSEAMPGGQNQATFGMQAIADLKAKEIRLGTTLLLNGYDRLLAVGDVDTRPLEFDGIEGWVTSGNGAHANSATTGAFSATVFDRFLAEGCAKPTHIFGHPAAIQEMMSGYFQLGFQGSQVISFADGDRVVPGMNFAGFVNTGVGRLTVVADSNFTRTNTGGSTFSSSLYPLRMIHNGEPLIYRATQIPLALTDLVPGCTAIAFEVWTKTALIVKALCAQGVYTNLFNGNLVTTCNRIG